MKWTRKMEDVCHGEAELQKQQALLREIPTISILMKPLFRTCLTGEDTKWLKQSSTQAMG